jgi:hypothetical protein
VVLLCAACGDDSGPGPSDLGGELGSAEDLSAIVSNIGGPCTASAQCMEGRTPTCFKATLFNETGKLGTTLGYCSSPCTNDADCGGNGSCLDEGADGKWCFEKCGKQTDCRMKGYACFSGNGGYCFPSGNLTCDPTATDGTCMTFGNKPGGCLRAAYGTGDTGYCTEACPTVGPGVCPVENGVNRQCVIYNQRGIKDAESAMNDAFLGAVCIDNYASNMPGSECLSSGQDYVDACADGSECFLTAAFTGGDNLCHPLCVQNGTGGDGGAACMAPATCHDTWGLFATSTKYGLCY